MKNSCTYRRMGFWIQKKIDRIRKDAHDKNNGETHWN